MTGRKTSPATFPSLSKTARWTIVSFRAARRPERSGPRQGRRSWEKRCSSWRHHASGRSSGPPASIQGGSASTRGPDVGVLLSPMTSGCLSWSWSGWVPRRIGAAADSCHRGCVCGGSGVRHRAARAVVSEDELAAVLAGSADLRSLLLTAGGEHPHRLHRQVLHGGASRRAAACAGRHRPAMRFMRDDLRLRL